MAGQPAELRRINWSECFAFTEIFRTFKMAIHPSQVAIIRDGYAPTPDQVQWARHVLAAARDERGVFQYEGIMVDAPVLRRAERIVQLSSDPGR